jgi:hypothetical protein
MSSHRLGRVLLLLAAFTLLLRLALVARQALWADEFFSIAMATGHSLEHPAAEAQPALGDFVEGDQARPAKAWERYMEFGPRPASAARVIRAVQLSDTSPPLYYLLLSGFMRVAGTSDAALGLFSLFWAIATLPLIWYLARAAQDERAAVWSTALYAIAPMSVYYSTEGRMYSLVWFLAAALAWVTLRLRREGARPVDLAWWTLIAAAGLLTHYFFVFVIAATALWLLLEPGRLRRWVPFALGAVVIVIVLPWFVRVPETLAAWRVTGNWLAGRPPLLSLLTAPFSLASGSLGVPGIWSAPPVLSSLIALALLALVVLVVLRRAFPWGTPAARLLWLWLAAAAIGPVVFDILRNTATSNISRYAISTLPAAMVLVGMALNRLPLRPALIWTLVLLLIWSPALALFCWGTSRAGEPFAAVANQAISQLDPGGLVLVHGIPSSVIGIARYLPPDTPVAAWVGQLGERQVPRDIERLIAGYPEVVVIRIHHVGEPMPELDWLAANAQPADQWRMQTARMYYYRPLTGSVFTR